MKVELFYFDGCPSWQNGLKNLEVALKEEGINAFIETIKVLGDEDATRLKFLGSPSFRLDGRDLWPEEREKYVLSCRVYTTPDGIKGWPSVEMLRKKMKAVKGDLQ